MSLVILWNINSQGISQGIEMSLLIFLTAHVVLQNQGLVHLMNIHMANRIGAYPRDSLVLLVAWMDVWIMDGWKIVWIVKRMPGGWMGRWMEFGWWFHEWKDGWVRLMDACKIVIDGWPMGCIQHKPKTGR